MKRLNIYPLAVVGLAVLLSRFIFAPVLYDYCFYQSFLKVFLDNRFIFKEEHTLANGGISTSGADKDQTSVKVLGMEMTASCEGGQKWNRPDSPIVPVASQLLEEPPEPPQVINNISVRCF